MTDEPVFLLDACHTHVPLYMIQCIYVLVIHVHVYVHGYMSVFCVVFDLPVSARVRRCLAPQILNRGYPYTFWTPSDSLIPCTDGMNECGFYYLETKW